MGGWEDGGDELATVRLGGSETKRRWDERAGWATSARGMRHHARLHSQRQGKSVPFS